MTTTFDNLEFGLDTFGDVTADPTSGELLSQAEVIRGVVKEAELADRVGIDVFGIGEHHRDDYAVTSPDIVLANIAAKTANIKLTTAVIVLSSDDPVRVFERFSTLQALSDGRAELTVGRGSFIESFPLFGYELEDYNHLFEDKLNLLAAALDADASKTPLNWEVKDSKRPAVDNLLLHPHAETPIKTWVAVGGSPESVVRAARYKFPLMLAVIGGSARRFRPFVDLYHRANSELGNDRLPVGIHSPGLIAATDKEAQERLYEHWSAHNGRLGAERGWPAPSVEHFTREVEMGSLYVGGPDTVARRIADTVSALELDRFVLKYSNGTVPHEYAMDTIRLYGEEVIPRVRRILDRQS